MMLLNPLAIVCVFLPLAWAAPAPSPQGAINVVQARQVTKSKLVEFAARDPARRLAPSSVPNPIVNRQFRIRFDQSPLETANAFSGTYATIPVPSGGTNTGADIGRYVRAGKTFQDAGLYSLTSAGVLVSAVDGKLAYASADESATLVFDFAPNADRFPTLASCQINGNNVLTCVRTPNPPPNSATYVCNTALAYGFCRQGGGAGGPRQITTAVFV